MNGDATTTAGAGAASGRELYGLAAEYATPQEVLSAAEAARQSGFRAMDAYTPFAVEGLDQALGQPPSRLGFLVLAAGILGIALGYGMQYFASVEYYPLNVGGRPLNSWPNFITITFEVTVLLAALTTTVFMLLRNGLPQPYHSIFNAPGFERVSRDRFFLCIEATDPHFELAATRAFLEGTGALAVVEVER